ncbi:MAG: site-specific integrase [Acidobacteria bacterium]|nr:site-specific integrase [Acidobacteriota bacterium]
MADVQLQLVKPEEAGATAAENADALALRHAVEIWAESSTGKDVYKRDELLHTKRQAVRSFFISVGHSRPEEVAPADVVRWCEQMETEELQPNTIYARVSRLAAFYDWLRANTPLGLQLKSNPARMARPPRPKAYQTESTKPYSDEEMNALLGVVKAAADAGKAVAKRDYALLRIYFMSGMRRTEVISLRGSDVELTPGAMILKYRRKGGYYKGREVTDVEARLALLEYLRAARREDVIGTPRPLWTRHDRAGRPGAPLTSHSFDKNLKAYAERAGVKDARIHRTRHTFARIVHEESGSLIEVQDALDHKDLGTTGVYIDRLVVKRDKHSTKIAGRIKSVSNE